MDQLLSQLGEVFAPFRAQIMHSKRPNIQLHLSPSNTLALWDSKIGGIPYLPIGQPYPSNPDTGNKLQLIAQINFAQLPSNNVYPSTGILQFFLDASDQLIGLNLNQPTDQTTFKIIFHEQVIEDASQLQNLDDLDLSAYIQYSPIHNQSRIQFVPCEQYIGLQDHDFAPLILGAENLAAAAKTWHGRDFDTEFAQPYQAALNQPDPHHLGGYPT